MVPRNIMNGPQMEFNSAIPWVKPKGFTDFVGVQFIHHFAKLWLASVLFCRILEGLLLGEVALQTNSLLNVLLETVHKNVKNRFLFLNTIIYI